MWLGRYLVLLLSRFGFLCRVANPIIEERTKTRDLKAQIRIHHYKVVSLLQTPEEIYDPCGDP
jgi:hypothetical protein